jgi:SAM-dependent MidA family methyltransferase
VLLANELLDALPVHQVVMRAQGLREVYVDIAPCSAKASAERLRLVDGPLSTPALSEYLEQLGVTLEPGWRAEINLRAVEWMREAARRLRRGFIILIDYGHEAGELYSPAHSAGTLTAYARHQSSGPESSPDTPAWLWNPGEQDLTAHVDFTSVRAAAEAEGLTAIAFLDQTYFLLGLLPEIGNPEIRNPQIRNPEIRTPQSAIRNAQCKTLLMPGGLGSTHKVLILGKDVGSPALRGCSFKVRVT